MGGGYSIKFFGTQGSTGEYQHYQFSLFETLPVRTKTNESGVDTPEYKNSLLKAKMKPCACCGEYTIPVESQDAICPICGWFDDDFQNTHPNSSNGLNPITLNEARKKYRSEKNK